MDDAARRAILALEEALLDPETRHNAEWLDRVLATDAVEFGKSGRIYDKGALIALLSSEESAPVDRFEIVAATVTELAPDAALLTYRLEPLTEEGAPSLRSSVWRLLDGRWQLLFHQGTAVSRTESG